MAKIDYRMPAEWEPQQAVWLTWPANVQTWPRNLQAAQIEFCALVHSLAEMVTVRVMVNQPNLEDAYQKLIRPDIRNVGFINIPTNDAWARDYAPTFVFEASENAASENEVSGNEASKKLVAIDWEYNAWGGKYPPFDDDQKVARKIAAGLSIEAIQPGLCFEGGAIETNGQGLVLSTLSCALDRNRNQYTDKVAQLQKFETAFENFLGAGQTIWLPGDALIGDDTDGHIDQLARFTDARTIVYAWCKESDPQRPALEANLAALRRGLAETGEAEADTDFQLIPLLVPEPIEIDGQRIPASYCNFLITNDLVVVPQFGCPEDHLAMDVLRGLFPDRYVAGLPSRNLAVGLGSFHCLSQQQPDLTHPPQP